MSERYGAMTEINFLEDQMKAKKKLNLPKNDADASRTMRLNWMQAEFSSNLTYLESYFKKTKGGDGN